MAISNTIIALAATVFFAANLLAHADALMDDAYITYQYARNLAAGRGLVFNTGGEATEGFTNLIWVLLIAPSFWIGVDPLLYARVLLVTSAVGTAIFLTFVYEGLVPQDIFRGTWPIPGKT